MGVHRIITVSGVVRREVRAWSGVSAVMKQWGHALEVAMSSVRGGPVDRQAVILKEVLLGVVGGRQTPAVGVSELWLVPWSGEGAWPGTEAGCWVGGEPEGSHSGLSCCSQLCVSPQPPLAGLSFISYSGTVSS